MKATFSHLNEEAEFQISTESLEPMWDENEWMLSATKNMQKELCICSNFPSCKYICLDLCIMSQFISK